MLDLKKIVKNGAQGGAPWRNRVSNDKLMFFVAWEPFKKEGWRQNIDFLRF